jgi:hypothetical protein
MAEQIITLEPEDDYVSIRDRLARVNAERVLLVLPVSDEPIRDRLGLVLLQRQAGRLGLELGLVTTNPVIAAEARDLGVPVFPSVEMGQSRQWRWPWRAPTRREPAQPPRPPDPGDLSEVYRRSRPRPGWQLWLGRFWGIVVFVFVMVAIAISVVYILPGGTVVLHPDTRDLSTTLMVVGDPALDEADYTAGRVPARLLRVEVGWRGSAATTGTTDIPDAPATGTVVFVNQGAVPVTVPVGTVVRTSTGTTIRFRTTRPVDVPGAIGATAEAPVVAMDPGPWGNVDANLINQIEGALALGLNVRNLEPMTGGGIRQARAVTQADLDRLRGQVVQQLFQLAKAEMANWMTASEFLAEESLSLFMVMEEDYSRYVGERADSVELEMTALIQGFVVDDSEGYGVVYTALAAETPAGYRLLPEEIVPRRGEVLGVDEDGRVTFLMQGQARIAAEIDQGTIADRIRGQKVELAEDWITREIPIQGKPAIRIWPDWFGRLPYLTIRIAVRVEMPE